MMRKSTLLAATGAVALSATLLGPAVYASTSESMTWEQFKQQFGVSAHRFDKNITGEAASVVTPDKTAYYTPTGSREIVTEASGTTVCAPPNHKGFMLCYLNTEGIWTEASLMEPVGKGWLTPMGQEAYTTGLLAAENLIQKAERQGGDWKLRRQKTPTGVRYTIEATGLGDGSQTESVSIHWRKRAVTVTAADSNEKRSLLMAKRTKERPLSVPVEETLTPGWG